MPESRITLDEWYRLENERALERARQRPEFNEAVGGEYRSRGGTAGWDECERIVLGWTVAENAELPSLVHVKPERLDCGDAAPSAAHGCAPVGQYEFKEGFVDKATLVFRPKKGFEGFPYADGFVDYPMGIGCAVNGAVGESVKAGSGIVYSRTGAITTKGLPMDSSAYGIVAKLKDAISTITGLLCLSVTTEGGEKPWFRLTMDKYERICKMGYEALESVPCPRNCDWFGTDSLDARMEYERRCRDCGIEPSADDAIEWLLDWRKNGDV